MMLARRKLIGIAGLLALLMAFLMVLSPAGMAEGDPIDFTIQVTPKALTEPGPVTVSLRVANTSSEPMTDPVTLYDPAGNVVKSFGNQGSFTLAGEAFRAWEGTWNVTQAQLDAGEFAYVLKYMVESDNGEMVEMERKATARIESAGESVALSITRTISPEVVRSGGTATVVYELYNSGNIELTDIRVKEKIARSAQTVKSLAANQRVSLTFSSRMGSSDLTSNATITYKTKGSTRTLTEKVEDAVIPLANPNLKITVSSPTAGVNIGDAATLVLTFTNSGNVSYSNVRVVDEKRGEIFSNLSIPAGATITQEKEFRLTEPTTFKITASLPDNTGETRTLTTQPKELTIGVFDPEKTLLLTLNLTADQDTVPSIPADVRFHLAVTNNSNVKAEKIAIRHGDTAIYTIASLEPGASTTLTRDVRISQAGKFRFTASVKDALNNTVTFDSNTVQIIYAQPTSAPTAVPVVTVAPYVAATPAPLDGWRTSAQNALMIALMVLGVLFGIAMLLFLVSSVVRIVRKAKSNAAFDHLELSERRDYTEPADEELEGIEARTEESMMNLESDLELTKDHTLTPVENAPELEDLPDWDGEGGYRVTRVEPKEEPAPVVEKDPETIEKETEQSIREIAQQADEALKNAAEKEAERIGGSAAQAAHEAVEDVKEAAQQAVEEAAPRRRHRRTQRAEDGE